MFPKSCDELFYCRISKKKFLGQSARYLYIYPTFVIINKDPNRKKADRIFSVASTKRVIWKYNSERPGKIRGFVLDYEEQYYEYYGDEIILQELKSQFAKLFFQARVQEEYVAQQVIGQGNYALVLELQHLHSEMKFASKCIDKQKLSTIDFGFESVQNEILIMRLLSPHQRLINLKEVYEGDSNIYLIMDLAMGGSLYSEMKSRKSLYTRNQVKLIMTQILQGLSYLHSKNVMHRDLKPENILFLEKQDLNTIRIADFGLAAIESQYPYLYPKCGTPGFVAPEIANLIDKSSSYSTQCDVFSAGVIFHILLLGEGLFNGNGHLDILKQNKLCDINLEDKKYKKIDSDAKDLLFKMIDRNPKTRYTAKQCLDHPYFYNDFAPDYMIPNLQKNNSQNSPVKEAFMQYLNVHNSPDLKLMRQNSKRLSIVTRTPLYAPKGIAESQPDLAKQFLWDDISSFSLDQLKNEQLNTQNEQQNGQQQFAT